MTALSLQNLSKSYGPMKVIHGVDLEINEGEFIVFVGPSGCGKSTLLRMIAGLEEISGGDLRIDGELVNDLPPAARKIAMVFQSYALYPHMSVRENMSFGLKLANHSKEAVAKAVVHAAKILQLEPYLDRLPKALSGGQRQRVAIGRAIVRNPRIFLFDEPLSNLDAALRVATRIEIAQLKEDMPKTTMIYVTHDQVEAMTLADRIVVLHQGRIEQVGTPMELYHQPRNQFVAGFIGSPAMNMLKGRIQKEGADGEIELLDGMRVSVPLAEGAQGHEVMVGLRPEDCRLVDEKEARPMATIRSSISLVERLGEVNLFHLRDYGPCPGFIAKLDGDIVKERGQSIALTGQKWHVFDHHGHRISLS